MLLVFATVVKLSANPGPLLALVSMPMQTNAYEVGSEVRFDMVQVAPQSKVSVKLVAQAGIGTVSCGVAKADADVIQISGHDGGTGASPVSSIKHAGGPIEMGLAEVHQVGWLDLVAKVPCCCLESQSVW